MKNHDANLKPLFIPLNTQYYEAYNNGSKTEELRLYGPRWNEETCKVERDVILSKGYGKSARMIGKISFFLKMSGHHLNTKNKQAIQEIYGTLDVSIAIIGIYSLKPYIGIKDQN